jgi:hypothetical protein
MTFGQLFAIALIVSLPLWLTLGCLVELRRNVDRIRWCVVEEHYAARQDLFSAEQSGYERGLRAGKDL